MVLVDFLGPNDLPDNSHERAMNQLVCHMVLITNAGVNFVYLFLIAGIANRSLQKNWLQKLALFGALMQLGSCTCSLTRYNIGDEFNFALSNLGAFCGLASGVFNNTALSVVWVHDASNRKLKFQLISLFILLASVVAMIMELKTFDETHFLYFRMVNMLNNPYTLVTCFVMWRALKNKKAKIDSDIIKHDDLTRLFLVLWIAEFVITVSSLVNVTLFIYAGGGLTFGAVNIATYYMGQMTDFYDKPIGGEGTRLLP